MVETNRTMVVVFLLCAAAVLAEGQTLDVCASCHVNATCDDKSDGSGKVCNCKYGFVGNGRTFCQDKDECQIGASKICGPHTTCHNTYGSYYCTCLSGYSPSNNLDVFIPNDGTSCQDIDECSITGLCGDGGVCRNLVGSFECSCQLGYQVHNGPKTFNPRINKAFCKVVDCGRPGSVKDMVLLPLTQTTYGSMAMFECAEGFVWRSGDNSSVCGADGRWIGPTAVCEVQGWALRCFMNVTLDITMLERAMYRCVQLMECGRDRLCSVEEGFQTKGVYISICMDNGQWTQPALSCQEILCGVPPTLPHTGHVWNGTSTPGSTVAYFCKTGFYHSQGNNISFCTIEGHWTVPDISCTEIDCGVPTLIPHSVMLWDNTSTVGSQAVYQCNSGYHNVGEGNVSVCTADGEWKEASLLCQEISCQKPAFKPHTKMLWDGTSHLSSVVLYQCEEGYHTRGQRNSSVCGVDGLWEDIDMWCEDVSCGPPLNLPHTNLLWNGISRPGSVVLYECMDGFYQDSGNNISTCLLSGDWGKVSVECKAKCGPMPLLENSEVEWHNRSVVIHRCVDGYHSWRGSNVSVCGSSGVWEMASLKCIEIKPPVNHLIVINEKCLHWKAEKYDEDTEVYKVTYVGSRDYQRSFHDQRKQFMRSKSDQLELCLNLLPFTNYSISISAVSAGFTATLTTSTSLPEPPAPIVCFQEFQTPMPTLRLQRSHNTLDPISLYQVFVLHVEGSMLFDCSSPASLHSLKKNKPSTEYITAQIDVRHVGTEMTFTVGDGLQYGGFFNAPLENGRNYYIILRAVSQWKKALKSTCVMWAKVGGTSYAVQVSALSAAATVGTIALIILGGYSLIWFLKKK
ncbi:sushi domain-containing protein 1 isoform X2 [Notolabrus celidotus]|uniref:sushi domain-containing protein 1 isoform X2 n=1 Tax=Notolabrus celidotus TaxID=1203425 RepID=UPI00148F59AD|nr:sushi domain-containing protein 1 isoform X2 [Notolabrus celidotus]